MESQQNKSNDDCLGLVLMKFRDRHRTSPFYVYHLQSIMFVVYTILNDISIKIMIIEKERVGERVREWEREMMMKKPAECCSS